MGMEAVSWEDGGAGGWWEGGGEGGRGAGVEVIGGDDGALWTLTLPGGAAGWVLRRVERRRWTSPATRATPRSCSSC